MASRRPYCAAMCRAVRPLCNEAAHAAGVGRGRSPQSHSGGRVKEGWKAPAKGQEGSARGGRLEWVVVDPARERGAVDGVAR